MFFSNFEPIFMSKKCKLNDNGKRSFDRFISAACGWKQDE
jgi:hypothetical protein